MRFFDSVEMKVEAQAWMRTKLIYQRPGQKTIGAKIDVSLHAKQFFNERNNLPVQERLAPGHGDDRRP
jgi:hypothetical protein